MGRPRKKRIPSLILTLDFGGSGLKCIYQVWGKEPEVLFMESFVIEAEAKSLKEKTREIGGGAYPENMAWVGVEDDYRAVGYFASCQYNAMPLLKPKKHSLAVYRTLAAVWVVQQRLKLPNSLVIALAVLLPPGELSDSQMFLKNLKEALNGFDTPTGKLNVKTTELICYPEGSGVYLMHCYRSGEISKKKIFALIMVGYRNASMLLSKRGMLTEAKSIDLGMIRYLELIIKKTSGLKAEQILKAISPVSASNPLPRDFLNLTELNLSMDLRKEQAEKIVEAVIDSKPEYLKAIQGWMSEVLPSELEEVVFCGGTVDYFKQELDGLFPATPVKWHGGFVYPEELEEEWLGNRLADAYGLSLAFTQEMEKKYGSVQKSVA